MLVQGTSGRLTRLDLSSLMDDVLCSLSSKKLSLLTGENAGGDVLVLSSEL